LEAYDILPLSDTRVPRLLPGLDQRERMASAHILDPDGSVSSAGRVQARVLRDVVPLKALARAPLWENVNEVVYRVIAANRHRLAKFVPDRPAVTRWRTSD
jgi:hypothetical protein